MMFQKVSSKCWLVSVIWEQTEWRLIFICDCSKWSQIPLKQSEHGTFSFGVSILKYFELLQFTWHIRAICKCIICFISYINSISTLILSLNLVLCKTQVWKHGGSIACIFWRWYKSRMHWKKLILIGVGEIFVCFWKSLTPRLHLFDTQ